jgi:hypothetical protein
VAVVQHLFGLGQAVDRLEVLVDVQHREACEFGGRRDE